MQELLCQIPEDAHYGGVPHLRRGPAAFGYPRVGGKVPSVGLRLSQKFEVGEYLRSRFVLASEELATLFKPDGHQSDMNDYFAQVAATVTISQSNAVMQPSIVQMVEIKEVLSSELLVTSENLHEERTNGRKKKAVNGAEQFQTTLF